MKKGRLILYLIPFISLLGNLFGFYLLDKTLHYRETNRFFEESFPNEGLHLVTAQDLTSANIDRLGIFVGGGLPRYWFIPNDFPFKIANRSGPEESISTTWSRFDETVIRSDADFVLINAGFCDIYNAIHDERDVVEVLDKTLDFTIKMAAKAKAHQILPILTTLTPVRGRFLLPHLKWFTYSTKHKTAENAAFREMNRRLLELSRTEGVPLIDFHKALCDEEGLLDLAYSLQDGEHLSLEGYHRLTDLLEEELERIFSSGSQDP